MAKQETERPPIPAFVVHLHFSTASMPSYRGRQVSKKRRMLISLLLPQLEDSPFHLGKKSVPGIRTPRIICVSYVIEKEEEGNIKERVLNARNDTRIASDAQLSQRSESQAGSSTGMALFLGVRSPPLAVSSGSFGRSLSNASTFPVPLVVASSAAATVAAVTAAAALLLMMANSASLSALRARTTSFAIAAAFRDSM